MAYKPTALAPARAVLFNGMEPFAACGKRLVPCYRCLNMEEPELKMFVIHANDQHGGFYLALVPASLDAAEMDAAFRELGIDADKVCELSGWRTTSENVAVAHIPFPGLN